MTKRVKTAEEITREREKILEVQKEWNLKQGMTEEQAQAAEIVSRREMIEETPPKSPSIPWAIVRLVLGLIGASIGIYGIWYSYQVMMHLHP
jgi:hypothetical protein